jgi:adenine-specific DNA methylase
MTNTETSPYKNVAGHLSLFERSATHAAASADGSVFRPVQFLGAKTRVLSGIVQAVADRIAPGGHVVDLFTGSSLVAQSLDRGGFRVTATDAMTQCVHFARALLAVGREPSLQSQFSDPAGARSERWEAPWGPWLERERAAIEACDADALVRLSEITPQVWRSSNGSPALRGLLSSYRPGEVRPGLVAAHYGGTYFGLTQAVEIDRIRLMIKHARVTGEIDSWLESALLTALLSAASECVFSAGKHYAQAHRIRPGKDLSFIRTRILADRSKDLLSLFRHRVHRVCEASSIAAVGHEADQLTLEDLVSNPDSLGRVSAFYADPPYTAQQYSRFYHVPEVICAYRVPSLQRVQGHITRGLYPDVRFRSRFCSRRLAPRAFRDLFGLVQHHRALLLLSYSASRSGQTGNERSIRLPELRSLLRAAFGSSVSEQELPVTYRQFNAGCTSVRERSDAELLFIAGANA